MRIDINDVTNLIVFASREKGKIQTTMVKGHLHVATSLCQKRAEMTFNHQEKIITPGLTIEHAVEEMIPSATQTPITPHIVGKLAIRDIELVVDDKEKMTAIVNGNLNNRFHVSYILLEYEKINDLLSEFEKEIKNTHIKTCLVKDSEDEITLVFKNQNEDSEKIFNVSFVKRNWQIA